MRLQPLPWLELQLRLSERGSAGWVRLRPAMPLRVHLRRSLGRRLSLGAHEGARRAALARRAARTRTQVPPMKRVSAQLHRICMPTSTHGQHTLRDVTMCILWATVDAERVYNSATFRRLLRYWDNYESYA